MQDNLLLGVEASKKIPFERVLFGLGIRFVGQTVAKKLATSFGSIERLAKASEIELVEVDEIGERIAQSVVLFLSNFIRLLDEMIFVQPRNPLASESPIRFPQKRPIKIK